MPSAYPIKRTKMSLRKLVEDGDGIGLEREDIGETINGIDQ